MGLRRLLFLGFVSCGGEIGVAGVCGVASAKMSVSGSGALEVCDGGGVFGAAVALFCGIEAMSTKLNSWPKRGLRLSNDLCATCQRRDAVIEVEARVVCCFAPAARD